MRDETPTVIPAKAGTQRASVCERNRLNLRAATRGYPPRRRGGWVPALRVASDAWPG
jgi:hypothetical protein